MERYIYKVLTFAEDHTLKQNLTILLIYSFFKALNNELRKHGTVGYQNNRIVTVTRGPLIPDYIRTAQNLTFLEQNPLFDPELEKIRQSEMTSRRKRLA